MFPPSALTRWLKQACHSSGSSVPSHIASNDLKCAVSNASGFGAIDRRGGRLVRRVPRHRAGSPDLSPFSSSRSSSPSFPFNHHLHLASTFQPTQPTNQLHHYVRLGLLAYFPTSALRSMLPHLLTSRHLFSLSRSLGPTLLPSPPPTDTDPPTTRETTPRPSLRRSTPLSDSTRERSTLTTFTTPSVPLVSPRFHLLPLAQTDPPPLPAVHQTDQRSIKNQIAAAAAAEMEEARKEAEPKPMP